MPARPGSQDWVLRDIRPGDVLFFETRTLRGLVVRLLDPGVSDYSHVGLAALRDGELQVVHADPRRGCVAQPLASLLDPDRCRLAAVMRLREPRAGVGEGAAEIALRLADTGMPFDHDFDIADTAALYCTELVLASHAGAGAELLPPDVLRAHRAISPGLLAGSSELVLAWSARDAVKPPTHVERRSEASSELSEQRDSRTRATDNESKNSPRGAGDRSRLGTLTGASR